MPHPTEKPESPLLHRPPQLTWRKPARSDNDNNPEWAEQVPLGFSPKPGK